MTQEAKTNSFIGIVSVTTTKTVERDWIGRVKEEKKDVTIGIAASVPQPLLDAATSIATAVPKISDSAQATAAAIKTRALDALPAPRSKKI